MQSTPERIWAAAQEHLRAILNADTYNLWFAPIQAKSLDGDCLTLEVANDFCEVWLEKNYLDLISQKLERSFGHPLQVKFEVGHSPAAASSVPEPGKSKTKSEAEPGERTATSREVTFNPRYTFDSFVVGN